MSGINGNDNLLYIRQSHFLTYDGTSDQSLALLAETKTVSLYATTACWVAFGTNPTAAAVAEKTAAAQGTYFIPATTFIDIPVPVTGAPAAPIKIAAIQSASGGNLYIYERSES